MPKIDDLFASYPDAARLLQWWDDFTSSLPDTLQHYDDYLHDMFNRGLIEDEIEQIVELDLKREQIARLKKADETFLKFTTCVPTGIQPHRVALPDKKWFMFRKPRITGEDWKGIENNRKG